MRLSSYNHNVYTSNNEILLFNALSGALIVVDLKTYLEFTHLSNENSILDFAENHPEFEEGKFIRSDLTDEIGFYSLKLESGRFDTKELSITICPSMACNFSCTYCYEDPLNRQGRMKDDVANRLVEFIEMYLPTINRLSITWYGGEPLLEIERIADLSKKIRSLCEKEGKELSMSLVTNGYLLTVDAAKLLVSRGIKNAQVTLDGPKRIHDKRRKLKSGGGSFDRILSNIIENKDIIDFNIRINVDSSNFKYLDELYEILKEYDLQDLASLGRVRDKAPICMDAIDCYIPGKLSVKHFSHLSMEQIEKCGKKIIDSKLKPRYFFCSAQSISSLLVDPSGYLYKCWNVVGDPSQRIGSIFFESEIPLNDVHIAWLTASPLKIKKCRSCNILPLCGGGCPHIYLFKNRRMVPECPPIKYNLPDIIRLAYKQSISESAEVGEK